MKRNNTTILSALLGIESNTEYITVDKRRRLLIIYTTEVKHLPMLRVG